MGEGVVAASDVSSRQEADQNLRSALEELSGLSQPAARATGAALVPAAPVPRTNPLHSSANETGAQRDSMRIVPLSAGSESAEERVRELAEILPVEATGSIIVRELRDPETFDERKAVDEDQQRFSGESSPVAAFPNRPADLQSALRELADQHSEPNSSESSAKVAPSHRPNNNRWLLGSALAVLAAFGVGFLVGRSFVAAPPQKDRPVGDTVIGDPSEAVAAVEKIPENAVTGRVMYADEAGAMKPDAGALVMLVPAENTAGLKLDARPLRDLQASDAKLAVEAAINVLKGSITRAAADGTFAMERRYSGPVTMLVISRHASRPESELVEVTAAKTLAAWFESPSQLTGRLQVQQQSLPAAEQMHDVPVEVTFKKP